MLAQHFMLSCCIVAMLCSVEKSFSMLGKLLATNIWKYLAVYAINQANNGHKTYNISYIILIQLCNFRKNNCNFFIF